MWDSEELLIYHKSDKTCVCADNPPFQEYAALEKQIHMCTDIVEFSRIIKINNTWVNTTQVEPCSENAAGHQMHCLGDSTYP